MPPYVVVDSEYNPETGQIFWIGMTFDGKTVYGMPWEYQYVAFVKQVCEDTAILKIGHNILADIRVLAQSGIAVRGSLYDTMLAHYCLYPGLDVGLDHAARFYLGDVHNWKGMEHTDPTYNALDVLYTHDIWKAQLAECAKRPVSPLPEIEARCRLIPVIQQMENEGMRVDVVTQRALITRLQGEIAETEAGIEERVKGLWAGRVEGAAFEARVKDEFALQVAGEGKGKCPKHPKSNGLKKPRACPQCWALYDANKALRERYKQARVDKGKAKGRVEKWQEGFNWASSEHLGWLLYEALGLPEQLDRKTRKRTTGAPAIEHLATMIEGARREGKSKSKYYVGEDKWAIVRDIKETQGKAKAISTFLELPLTDDGWLRWPHLSYKINGTETGRLAGGEDRGGDTDKLRAEGHSLMNIPQEWRRIYVPPPHHIFLACDYSNQEGRLAAYISNDLAYIEAFAEEDRTGIDVHSQMAALIFNIDPADARTVKVMYKGVEKKARDVGKAANHASSYALNPVSALHFNFGMPLADAVRVNGLLHQTRPTLMKVKQQMVKEILGEYAIDVGRTGKARAALIVPGRRFQATPWGWQMVWQGVGKVVKDPVTGKDVAVPEQANEVLAFGLGQAPGASIWARVARQVWDAGVKIAVGNYDNLVVAVPRTPVGVREGKELLLKVMEQKWGEIGGRGLPVEGKVGLNWGDYSEDNSEGLRGWDDD